MFKLETFAAQSNAEKVISAVKNSLQKLRIPDKNY